MSQNDFLEPDSEDRERVTLEQFERAGITAEREKPWPKPDPAAPGRLAWLAEREGFFTPPGSVTISPTLAKMLGYMEPTQ